MYDYYLGGSHNFTVDRQVARRVIELWPELPVILQANRAFCAAQCATWSERASPDF
jgi:hypothetical protein